LAENMEVDGYLMSFFSNIFKWLHETHCWKIFQKWFCSKEIL